MRESPRTIIEKSGLLATGLGNRWDFLIGTGNMYGARLAKHSSPMQFLFVLTRAVYKNTWRLLKSFLSFILSRPSSLFVFEFPIFIPSKKTRVISAIETIHFSQANGSMVVIQTKQVTKIYFRAIEASKIRLSIQEILAQHSALVAPVYKSERNGLLLATFPRYRPIHPTSMETPVKLSKTVSELSDILSDIKSSLSDSLTIYNQILGWLADNSTGLDQNLKDKILEVCLLYTSSLDRAEMECNHLQHGDLWHENILLTPEPVVIDFDSLILSPKHYDLVYFVLSTILYTEGIALPAMLTSKQPPRSKCTVLEECRDLAEVQGTTSAEWMACENLFLLMKFCFCFTHNTIFFGREVCLLEKLGKRIEQFPNGSSWVSSALGL